MRGWLAAAAVFLLGAAPDPIVNSVEVRAGTRPMVATIGGQHRIVYELHITNLARDPVMLAGLDIADQAGRTIAHYTAAALGPLIDAPGIAADQKDRTTLAAGRRAIVYLELPVGDRLPTMLNQRLALTIAARRAAVTLAPLAVKPEPAPILGPPLGAGNWVAVYAPELDFGHRRYVYALDGIARIPGRFAIDWFRVDADGRHATAGGDPVLAVADGTIAAVRDDVPDPARPDRAVALGDATGNYVALALGGGRYAFYEHLARGIAVRVRQRVRRGQPIARLGMTGQAGEPHLHFHVADANRPLAAEGVPYRLTGFTVIGGYHDIFSFDRGERFTPGAALGLGGPNGPGLPSPNTVGRFTP